MKKVCLLFILCSLFIMTNSGCSQKHVSDNPDESLNDKDTVDDDISDSDTPDTESDKDETSASDDDYDTVNTNDPCKKNPCAHLSGSTGECFPDGDSYYCGCNTNYTWEDDRCKGDTRIVDCENLPENAHWSTASTVEQTWDRYGWGPSNEGSYVYSPRSEDCLFTCDEGYFWNASECVNPCKPDPCAGIGHSSGHCFSVGVDMYTCECDENYYWWGKKRGCTTQKPGFGNICTGQSLCYDDSGTIDCPAFGESFFGQDPQYAGIGACSPIDLKIDYTVPEEPVVVSANTNLMWQGLTSEEGSQEEALDYCENLVYAGYDDWRLPSIQELISIMTSNEYFLYHYPFYFPNLFEGTTYAWSSTIYPSDTKIAWQSSLRANYTYALDAIYTSLFWCVRGEGLPSSEFETSEINGEEVVTDKTTGLMWQNTFTMQQGWGLALAHCEKLNYAGFSDWRLPNRNELASLIDYSRKEPASNLPFMLENYSEPFSKFDSFFSSTLSINAIGGNHFGTNYASAVDFSIGYIGNIMKEYSHLDNYVTCVRSEICPEGYFLRGLECLENPCREELCEIENSTGLCIPETETEHECECLEGFFWNGSKCMNPCDDDPCSEITNSDQTTCHALSSDIYYCGCLEGYTWNNGKCDTFATGVMTVGNICTGQKKCYDNEGEANCPAEGSEFYGQDAQYASITCSEQDFTVKTVANQNIVVDNNTGLEWQQDIHLIDFTWNEAWIYCEELEYAGQNDWRLPAPHEIITIHEYEKSISSSTGISLSSNLVWTSVTDMRDPEKALTFDSRDGFSMYYAPKTNIYDTVCVRGRKLPLAKLTASTINGDTVITDSTTGHIWQPLIQSNKKIYSWAQALAICEDLTYAGHDDWRLPNKNELSSLVYFGEYSPVSEFFNFSNEFISSTTDSFSPFYAVKINLNGEIYSGRKECSDCAANLAYSVICIRN